MKVGQSPSLGRNSDARVVLPAPLGPAIIRMFFSGPLYLPDGLSAWVQWIVHGHCLSPLAALQAIDVVNITVLESEVSRVGLVSSGEPWVIWLVRPV